ncbi:MAG: DUF4286 family protein [Flavisolibacter sp.]
MEKQTQTHNSSEEATAVIYNVTIKVNEHIAGPWLEWLLNIHIPALMQTGCFTRYQVVRLLEVDDSEGPTYAVQYHAASKANYNRYIEKYAGDMRALANKQWGDQFIAFRSVMEVVQ